MDWKSLAPDNFRMDGKFRFLLSEFDNEEHICCPNCWSPDLYRAVGKDVVLSCRDCKHDYKPFDGMPSDERESWEVDIYITGSFQCRNCSHGIQPKWNEETCKFDLICPRCGASRSSLAMVRIRKLERA